MSSTTITVKTWGPQGIGDIRVRVPEGMLRTEAAIRSIERRTGLKDAACRLDSTRTEGGKPVAHINQMTLGRPLRIGGFSVEGTIWFSVPL